MNDTVTAPTETAAPAEAPQSTGHAGDAPPAAELETQPPASYNLQDVISEDYRDHPAIKELGGDVNKLAENYLAQQAYLGKPALRPLDENASPEAREAWERQAAELGYYRAPQDGEGKRRVLETLGAPTDPSGYDFELPEGLPADDPNVQQFREAAFELGMTKEQAAGWFDKAYRVQAEQTQQTQAAREAAMNGLRDEWSEAYEGRVKLARATKERVFDAVLGDAFKDTPVQDLDPSFIKLLYEVGARLGSGEGGADLTTEAAEARAGRSKQEIQDKIDSVMRDKGHPYWNRQMPGHKKAVDDLFALREKLNDGAQASPLEYTPGSEDVVYDATG